MTARPPTFFCLVGKLIGSEEFLNQIVEALGIIIDRRPKGRPRKWKAKP